MKDNEILCSNCGAIIDTDDYETINGEIYCSDCIEHEFVTCDCCGTRILADNTVQNQSYPVIVTPSPNGFILTAVDFEDVSAEADNIQYGISCIQSALSQKLISITLPDPTPANELVLNPSEFVVMISL